MVRLLCFLDLCLMLDMGISLADESCRHHAVRARPADARQQDCCAPQPRLNCAQSHISPATSLDIPPIFEPKLCNHGDRIYRKWRCHRYRAHLLQTISMAKELQAGSDVGFHNLLFTASRYHELLLQTLIVFSVFIMDVWWMMLSPLLLPLANLLPRSMRFPWLP